MVDIAGGSSRSFPEGLLDGDSASARARRLLCEILPETARTEFLTTGSFHHAGNGVSYRISERSQTQIYTNGRPSASACVQLSIPAPGCDRMIAEYLILKNDERLYWKLANVLPLESNSFDYRLFLIAVLDVTLLLSFLRLVYQLIR